jgi:hypothetical protein
MKIKCPYCSSQNSPSGSSDRIKKSGRYRRKSDSRSVQIFKCLDCMRYFSTATFHPCYRQKKRQMNFRLYKDFCSSTSQRRAALIHGLSRTTVARKLRFLGQQAMDELSRLNLERPPANEVQFDDMETFEHTKCKPLSITLAVEKRSRWILGFEVSQMAAKGRLAKIAIKKYGFRRDFRARGRKNLFRQLRNIVSPDAVFESDQNPYYSKDLKTYFPNAKHLTFKGLRGSIVGQGELKKVRFDPLFSLNHSCAMLRDNIKRLSRRTWCTTKLPANLRFHIAIYALFHNTRLLIRPTAEGWWAGS